MFIYWFCMGMGLRKKYLNQVFAASPVITLPNGQIFNLAKARERTVRLIAHKGFSVERQREQIKRQANAFRTVSTAVRMHNNGASNKEIAVAFGKHPDTIRNWFAGKLPEAFMTSIIFKRIRAHRVPINWKNVLTDQGSRAKLAYCIGALFGNLAASTDRHGHSFFSARVSSHDFAVRLAEHLSQISGTKKQLKRKRSPQGNMVSEIRANSVELVQFANKITNDQTRSPVRILKTDVDRQHFVKGYWDSRGHVSLDGRITLRMTEPQIKKTIEDYLNNAGIKFRYTRTELIILPDSKQKFAEKIGFTDKEKNKRLAQK